VSDAIDRPPESLGARLKLAREGAGLGLSDLAQQTHVRRAYLEALEEGRYQELPEDVYSRNFVRLYAQTVGLEAAPLLELYQRERRAALGTTTLDQRLDHDRQTAVAAGKPAAPRAPTRGSWPAWLFSPWTTSLVLVVVVVGLAAWGFDQLFSAPGGGATTDPAPSASAPADPAADAATGASADTPSDPPGTASAATADPPPAPAAASAEADAVIRIDIVTEPAGAAITIDGFPLPGRTPLTDVPVSARAGRLVRAELDGYEPAEARVDLLADARVDLELAPIVAASDAAVVADVGADRVALTITDTTWLEVYRSGARNEGERLVYTTAQPGASYEFALPVFVYVGNAAGVRVNLAGQDLGPMGGPGAVLGRAFER
jgi:cytoskeleton protein RodZ